MISAFPYHKKGEFLFSSASFVDSVLLQFDQAIAPENISLDHVCWRVKCFPQKRTSIKGKKQKSRTHSMMWEMKTKKLDKVRQSVSMGRVRLICFKKHSRPGVKWWFARLGSKWRNFLKRDLIPEHTSVICWARIQDDEMGVYNQVFREHLINSFLSSFWVSFFGFFLYEFFTCVLRNLKQAGFFFF